MGAEDKREEWFVPHRLAQADSEVADYYTSSVGVKAQRYEPSGGTSVEHTNALPGQRFAGEAARHDVVGRLIAASGYSQTLRLVYEPFGVPTWLASALSPRTGRGSFVRLAVRSAKAMAAWQKAFPEDHRDPSPAVVLAWVNALGAHATTTSRLEKWIPDCETERTAALAAYEALRREAAYRAKADREARKSEARVKATSYVDELLGKRTEKEVAKIERKLKAS